MGKRRHREYLSGFFNLKTMELKNKETMLLAGILNSPIFLSKKYTKSI
jgi:hypothetical protein